MFCQFSEIPGTGGAIGQIMLDRPKALNAITADMTQAIAAKLDHWAKDAGIKAVVIRSSNTRAFCAGGDLRLLHQQRDHGQAAVAGFFAHEYRLNKRIFSFPKPYIALLEGITMGGGAGLSIHGSHRVAGKHLVFAMPETGIGFFPDVGASYFLSRCPGDIGLYLGLTGARIDCHDALAIGLIDRIIPAEQFDLLVQTLAKESFTPLRHHPLINTIIKRFALTPGTSPLLANQTMIEQHFSQPTLTDIFRSLAADDSPWAKQCLKTLQAKSPHSLMLTFKQLTQAKTMNFEDCMAMEHQLATQCLAYPDLYEGIRAAIIDKDHQPQWQAHKTFLSD